MRILGLLILLFSMSCSSTKHAKKNMSITPETSISLERTACFGTCPVYKVTIFANGTVFYKGERNVDHVGSYTAFLDKNDALSLFTKISTYAWEKYPDKYPIDNYDFPQFHLEYVSSETTKLIKGNSNAAEELIALCNEIDKLLEELILRQD